MEYTYIKNTNLKVSRLCIGGCPMGGYGWGKVSYEDIIETVHLAIEKGINFFDTADVYGLGRSEEILGQAIKGQRDKVVVATKFGVRIENGETIYDNSPKWIEKALKASLKRLKTDYIDLYQVHYRDGHTPLSEVYNALKNLKVQGLIKYFGLSNIYSNDIEEIKKYKGYFVSFQDEYSLACRKNEKDIFNISELLEMTPLTWGSLGQGILTGKYDKNVTFDNNDRRSRETYANFHGDKLLKNLEIVDVLKEISIEQGCSVSAVAVRFILDYIENSVVLAGMKNTRQLNGNLEAIGWHLSKEQLLRLQKISG